MCFQQRQHFFHHIGSYPLSSVFFIQRDCKGGSFFINMSVIIHNTYPYCTDHFPFTVCDQTKVIFFISEVLNIQFQFR